MRKFDKIAIIGILLLFTSFSLFSAEKQHIRSKLKTRQGAEGQGFMMFFKTLDELNISNTQLIQLRMLFDKNKPQKEEFGKQLELHKNLMKEGVTLDEAKKIIEQISQKHQEMMLKHFQMKQEMAKILTAEQMKELEKHHMRGRGKGMHGRRQDIPMPPMAPELDDEVEP